MQNQHPCNNGNYSGDSHKSVGLAGPYVPNGSIVEYEAQHRTAGSQEKDCYDKAWLRERQQEKPCKIPPGRPFQHSTQREHYKAHNHHSIGLLHSGKRAGFLRVCREEATRAATGMQARNAPLSDAVVALIPVPSQ